MGKDDAGGGECVQVALRVSASMTRALRSAARARGEAVAGVVQHAQHPRCFCRCAQVRPLIPQEVVERCTPIIRYPQPNQVVIGNDRAFTFDYVYPETAPQAEVYDRTVRPLVQNFLKGYNATVIAYGQTGSGKTFSMGTGSPKDIPAEMVGVVPRMMRDVFDTIRVRACAQTPPAARAARAPPPHAPALAGAHARAAPQHQSSEQHAYRVRVSFLEIHNEEIIDLLDTTTGFANRSATRRRCRTPTAPSCALVLAGAVGPPPRGLAAGVVALQPRCSHARAPAAQENPADPRDARRRDPGAQHGGGGGHERGGDAGLSRARLAAARHGLYAHERPELAFARHLHCLP
jgi:hypothetical protein